MREFKEVAYQDEIGQWIGQLTDLNPPPPGPHDFISDDDDAICIDMNNAAEELANGESYHVDLTVYKNGEMPPGPEPA